MTTLPESSDGVAFARRLDVLLAPMTKHSLYPLPTPPALVACTAPPSHKNEAVSTLHLEKSVSLQSTPQADTMLSVDEMTMAECRNRVKGLTEWQLRVEEGLARGHECQQVLGHVLDSVRAMRAVTKSVQDQSDSLSHNASVLVVQKTKLERVQNELKNALQHFTRMEDLCREAEDPMLNATSARFPALFQNLQSEMEYLSRHAQYKSARTYATKLSMAQQQVTTCLRDAVLSSFTAARREAAASDAYQRSMGRSEAQPTALLLQESPPADSALPPDAVASSATFISSLTPFSPQCVTDASGDRGDPTGILSDFTDALRDINSHFLKALEAHASLRRLVELRSSFSYTGAEVFGEEPLDVLARDSVLEVILRSYRETRVSLVGAILRRWLLAWGVAEGGLQSGIDRTSSSTLLDTSAQSVGAEVSSVSSTLRHLVDGSLISLPQLAAHVCSLLEVSLEAESKVLDCVWLREDFINTLLPQLVADMAEELYHVFRSRLLRVDELPELARTVEQIEVVNLRYSNAAGIQAISDLWMRMLQDTQERIIFRTSVFLRQDVQRCPPSTSHVQEFIRLATWSGSSEAGPADKPPPLMFIIPGVQHAVHVLQLLYATLEFSVFSTFAKDAVNLSVAQSQMLCKMLKSAPSLGYRSEAVALLCQLAHLLFVRQELNQIDANITVVERSLDLVRQKLVHSSRESKHELEGEVHRVSARVLPALGDVLAYPLTGAAYKTPAEICDQLVKTDAELAWCNHVLGIFLFADVSMRTALANALTQRRVELEKDLYGAHTELASRRKHSTGAPMVHTGEHPIGNAPPAADETPRTFSTPAEALTSLQRQPPSPVPTSAPDHVVAASAANENRADII